MIKTLGSCLSNHPSFNDGIVFGYYSMPSYSSFNNINYINFLVTVGAIGPENVATDSQWSLGLMWQSVLLAFACEKYAITLRLSYLTRLSNTNLSTSTGTYMSTATPHSFLLA